MANFDRDQKNALMIPAKKVYGDVAKWDDKILGDLCNLLEALPVWGSSKYDRELNVVTCIFQTTLTQHGGHKSNESEAEKGSVLVT